MLFRSGRRHDHRGGVGANRGVHTGQGRLPDHRRLGVGCLAANAHRRRCVGRYRRFPRRCARRHPLGLGRAVLQAASYDYDDIDDEYDQYHHINDHRSTNHDQNVNFFDDVDDLDTVYNFDDVDDIDDLPDNDLTPQSKFAQGIRNQVPARIAVSSETRQLF